MCAAGHCASPLGAVYGAFREQDGIEAVRSEVNLHRFFWREPTLIGARLHERAADAFSALESASGIIKVLIDCKR